MAIKAALTASLLVALLSLAAATTITTVTTTEDETNPRGSRQCSQQVEGHQFRACQRYMRQGRSSRPYLGQEEEEEEEFGPENPQQQYLQECCQQLREMDRQQCGCEAIRHAVRQAQQGGKSYQTGLSEQIYEKARQLPRRCNLSQQKCRFNVVFV